MPLGAKKAARPDVIVTVTGAQSLTWNLTRDGGLLLTTAGSYTFNFFNLGRSIRVKGVAAGQAGNGGLGDSTRSQGGGGGGAGAADLTGIVEVLTQPDYSGKVGAPVSSNDTTGTAGETQFRRGTAGTLLLDLGSAIRTANHLGNTGTHRASTGGVARTGSAGKVNGGDGGLGGAVQPVNEPGEATHGPSNGSAAATGAAGGGGGGQGNASPAAAGAGGNGSGQTGGGGGSPGAAGSNPSPADAGTDSDPGTAGTTPTKAGGGGGAGGGANLTGHENGGASLVTRQLGGGGGGGGGDDASPGGGGAGGKGGLLIEAV